MIKRVILYITFTAILIFGQDQYPKLTKYATDFTNTLSQKELSYLNTDLKNFDDTTSNQVVFLMISSLDNYPIEMYTYEVAARNKIGTKENNNGVLLFVAKNDRKMRIEVGYGLEGALPDALASSIIRNEIAPYFRKNNYYGGVKAGLDAIKAATVGEYTREKRQDEEDDGRGFPIIYIIIFIIISLLSGRRGGGGLAGLILLGGLSGGHRSSGGGFGGGSFGGFSGGGGSFGGGGASGGW